MEEQLVALTTTAAARILGGVLSEAMQKRSIDSLARIDPRGGRATATPFASAFTGRNRCSRR